MNRASFLGRLAALLAGILGGGLLALPRLLPRTVEYWDLDPDPDYVGFVTIDERIATALKGDGA